jgi:hypothetical protein
MHYARAKTQGTLGPTAERLSASTRFWSKVERTDSCWYWTASLQTIGYGQFGVVGRGPALAHRFAYEDLVGPIPEGLHIDHLCMNKRCVNPAHLEAVTQQENNRRKDVAYGTGFAKTHCKNGHEFTPENTRIRDDGKGYRTCLACRKISHDKSHAKARLARAATK